MSFDDLQRIWRSQDDGGRVHIRYDILLREIKQNKQAFELAILWRDFREVGVAGVMTGVLAYFALTGNGWPLWLVAASTFWIAAFMTVDRLRQRRHSCVPCEPVITCVKESVHEVDHQIWLLRNVLWWYLLPLAVGIATFYAYVGWLIHSAPLAFLLKTAAQTVPPPVLAFWFIYWLNRRAAKGLAERKAELEELLKDLAE